MEKRMPTSEFYETLQRIYQVFNTELFSSELPNCLITVQRKKRVMGYFSPNRWVDDGENKIHELALNPSYFTNCNFIEVFQTIVHEMCHLWQFEYGSPSRRSYHNKEWSSKMQEVGLIPSDTGLPGGKKTGQNMNDYPKKDGLFENVCIKLFKEDLFIKWFDRFPNESNNLSGLNLSTEEILSHSDSEILEVLYTTVSEVISDIVPIEEIRELNQSKQKTKYRCEGCLSSLWGRANLDIKCNSCNMNFKMIYY